MGGGGTLSKGREGNYEEDEGWKHIGPNGILVEVWRFQGEAGLFNQPL